MESEPERKVSLICTATINDYVFRIVAAYWPHETLFALIR
jgi:hypothetical protein